MVDESEAAVPPLARKRLWRSRKQMFLQIAAATIILFCGVVIGSGAALLHFKDNIVRDRRPPLGDIVEDIRTRYDLTEEQTKGAEAALGSSRERMRTLFEEFRQKMEAEFQQLSSAMKGVLTPEQFERWESDFKSRRGPGPGRFGPGRPGPGGGRGFGGPGPGTRSGPGRPRPGEPEFRTFRPNPHDRPEPNSSAEQNPPPIE